MEFSIKSTHPDKQRTACTVVGIFENGQLTAAAAMLDRACGNALRTLIEHGDFEGRSGASLMLHHVPNSPCERILLIGLGRETEFREKDYGNAVRAAMKALKDCGAAEAYLTLTTLTVTNRDCAWKIRQAVLIGQESGYRFEQFKSKKGDKTPPLAHLLLAVDNRKEIAAAEAALAEGLAIAEGIALAKNLGNLPGNICTPNHLADTARQLAQEHALDCEILDRDAMAQLGMHSLLSVARGADQPPRFIVLRYRGLSAATVKNAKNGTKTGKPIVLIGKGITFDSGGISLKPGEGMDEMKFDMCGAAAVLGTLKAVARMRLALDLVVIVPASENMPGGSASKPGDIVTSMSGQTIEILNTDAEGRLILCDALTYAEQFKPKAVIDVATLTGACIVALGHDVSGLMGNNQALVDDLLAASLEVNDKAWQLPLFDTYKEQLKSNFADLPNIGTPGAGTITAAMFLANFTEDYPWAHLDIAGTAWKSGKEKGATGRPVPLLLNYLRNL